MTLTLDQWHDKLRSLVHIAGKYDPVLPMLYDGYPIALHGHSPAKLSHTILKTDYAPEFLLDQALYMEYLGPGVCPIIHAYNKDGYIMEYLHPAKISFRSIQEQEKFLSGHVWPRPSIFLDKQKWVQELDKSIGVVVPKWACEEKPCLIHGDPTLDNMLLKDGRIRITDPIPPQYLNRPCIRSVDQGRLLQSFLGWEKVLRGLPLIVYEWPGFMLNYESACRAIFWCMVVLKRIAVKDTTNAGKWAKKIAGELECELSF